MTWYRFQGAQGVLETHSDTDWAGRSTTGGFTSIGSHLLQMWCRTQAIVALRIAEAELYGVVRASAETLGVLPLAWDLGLEAFGRIMGGASAAQSVVSRQGLGKLRPVDTHYFWVQEKAEIGEPEYKKVKGNESGAEQTSSPRP